MALHLVAFPYCTKEKPSRRKEKNKAHFLNRKDLFLKFKGGSVTFSAKTLCLFFSSSSSSEGGGGGGGISISLRRESNERPSFPLSFPPLFPPLPHAVQSCVAFANLWIGLEGSSSSFSPSSLPLSLLRVRAEPLWEPPLSLSGALARLLFSPSSSHPSGIVVAFEVRTKEESVFEDLLTLYPTRKRLNFVLHVA